MLFVLPTLNREENQFLEAFYLMTSKIKLNAALLISVMLLFPIIVYSVFLISLAIPQSFVLSMLSIAVSLLVLIAIFTLILIKKLDSLPYEHTFVQIRFLSRIAKPSFLFFIEHLIRNDIVLLFLSKTYTCLMIIGTAAMYSTDQFDLRLLSTGVLLAFVGNVAILHKYVWFYHHELKFIKNLPVSAFSRILLQLLTFIILLIPEFAVISRHYPLDPGVADITGIILFGISIATLIYGLLILKQVELSDFVIKIFWLIVLSTFLILFSIHPLILGLIYIFVSFLIMYLRHYKFEFTELN